MIGKVLVFFLRVYRWTLSPFLSFVAGPGAGCRFEPSCSVYAIGAIQEHGAAAGSFFAIKRLCRCHPWGGMGYDPVPPRADKEKFSKLDLTCEACGVSTAQQTTNLRD